MDNINSENSLMNKVNKKEASEPNISNNSTTAMPHLNIGQGNNLDDVLNNMGISSKSISTGIEELDKHLNGGIRAGVTVMAAKPGIGKTTAALAIAENLSKLGNQVIYFCNDMSKEEIVAKGLSRTSYILAEEEGFSTTDVLQHQENGLKESKLFSDTCEAYRNNTLNLRIMDVGDSLVFKHMCTIIKEYVEEQQISPIIIIDYIQKLVVEGTNSDKEKMDHLIEVLKVFTISYKLPIILISTVNRMSYNKELTMDSLKESGGLEYNADTIVGIQHEGVGNSDFNIKTAKGKKIWEMELVILKQRLGGSDIKIPIKFYPKYNMFPYYTNTISSNKNKKIKKTSDHLNGRM